METDVKIGDIVKLISHSRHNSDCKNYIRSISFTDTEIGSYFPILDIIMDFNNKIGFKVQCIKGITYLRRDAFDIQQPTSNEPENYDYLIPILKQLNND